MHIRGRRKKRSRLGFDDGLLKKTLKRLEREWLDKVLDECQTASESRNIGKKYRILRQLGGRSTKPNTGTIITTEEFKNHFKKVSCERYNKFPESIAETVAEMGWRTDEKAKLENGKLNSPPTMLEIHEAIMEMRDSAPGKECSSTVCEVVWELDEGIGSPHSSEDV